MATLRELKTRIGSVSSSEKITGAMKMISSAKVHKNEQELRRLLPFKNQIQQIMGHVLSSDESFVSPLIEEREIRNIVLVVYGSDDGLCGAYNMNVFKRLLEEVNALQREFGESVTITIYPVGRKVARACNYLKGANIKIETIEGIDSKMNPEKVNDFTLFLKNKFTDKETDLVKVVYMRFFSISRQRPTVDTLFPVKEEVLLAGVDRNVKKENRLYIFEPDPNSIFNEVLPMFVLSMMQEVTIENRASEQAARVMAMQAANDNAKKLNEELQLEYNKLRQQSITTELLDILGGQVER